MSYVAVSYSELKINLLIKLFGTMEIKTKQFYQLYDYNILK